LLGLVHGHFDLHLPDTDADIAETDTTSRLLINSGIAIVVPAIKIIETLNHPTLLEERRRAEEEKLKSEAATLD
jgi:hypothetical protein